MIISSFLSFFYNFITYICILKHVLYVTIFWNLLTFYLCPICNQLFRKMVHVHLKEYFFICTIVGHSVISMSIWPSLLITILFAGSINYSGRWAKNLHYDYDCEFFLHFFLQFFLSLHHLCLSVLEENSILETKHVPYIMYHLEKGQNSTLYLKNINILKQSHHSG